MRNWIVVSFVVVYLSLWVSVSGFVPAATRSTGINSSSSSRTQRDMFTGIVEEMGTVVSMEERDDMTLWDGTKGKGTELVVQGDVVMDGAYLG